MYRNIFSLIFCSVSVLLFLELAVFPDSIVLKNGSIIEGVVSKDDGKEIVLDVTGGKIVISHKQIETIIQSNYVPDAISYDDIVDLPKEVKTNIKPVTASMVTPVAVVSKTSFILNDENKTPEQVEINRLLNKIMENQNEAWKLTPEIVAKGKEEVPYLLGLLTETKEASLKRWIIYILGQIKDPASIEALAVQLKNNDENIRIAAVNALRFSKSAEVKSALKEMLLVDTSVSVKLGIINAFSDWQDISIIPLLINLLGTDTDSLRSTITDTLVRFHESMVKEGNLSIDIINILVLKVNSANEVTRKEIINVLGKLKDKRAKDILIRFLADDDPETRGITARALIGMADKEIIKILSDRLLEETDISAKIQIIQVFQESGSYDVIPLLIETLQEKSEDIRLIASRALRTITKRSFGANYETWKKWWDNLQGK